MVYSLELTLSVETFSGEMTLDFGDCLHGFDRSWTIKPDGTIINEDGNVANIAQELRDLYEEVYSEDCDD